MGLDDFVLCPRLVGGRRVAESLASGAIIEVDLRLYVRTPLVYRGKMVLAKISGVPSVVDIERLYGSLRDRERVEVSYGRVD